MGHHMPPRTTQQSHSAARPGGRVSDRTMVGTSPPFGLCSFSRERHCSVDVKTISELRISATQHDEKGWMPKNHLFLQQREKCFLLTSPFIEPALIKPCQRRIASTLNPQEGERHERS